MVQLKMKATQKVFAQELPMAQHSSPEGAGVQDRLLPFPRGSEDTPTASVLNITAMLAMRLQRVSAMKGAE